MCKTPMDRIESPNSRKSLITLNNMSDKNKHNILLKDFADLFYVKELSQPNNLSY
jgi:hypothetical protein